MKQNNYTRMTAVYTGISLVNLAAVICVLRNRPNPMYLFGAKLPHWFILLAAVLFVFYYPFMLLRIGKGENAEKNFQTVSHSMKFILPLQLIFVWILLLCAKPEPDGGRDAGIYWMLALIMSIIQIILSNHLPRLRQNDALGIRNRWTKSNAVCWTRTHRFAGRLCVCTGITAAALLLLGRLTGPANMSFSACILGIQVLCMLIPPYIYAYRHRNDAE